jgi:hypothetical protein
MPAQNVHIPANTWTLLTVNDVTALTVSNPTPAGVQPVLLKGTVGATPPTTPAGAIPLESLGSIFSSDATLAEMFPGLGAVTRVYAWSEFPTVLMVSHA